MVTDLGKSRYMGRGILVGLTTRGDPAVVYFAQGRSPPSRQRRLELLPDEGRVYMDVNSQTSVAEMQRKGGNPQLLLYNAMRGDPSGLIVVSNGAQTDCDPIWEGDEREAENLKGVVPVKGIFYRLLNTSRDLTLSNYVNVSGDVLEEWGSEPDPCRTARIVYAGDFDNPIKTSWIGIALRPRYPNGELIDGDTVVGSRGFADHEPGKGFFTMFATYGVNNPPYHAALPPGVGRRIDWTREVMIDSTDPDQMAQEVFQALPGDITVGVAAAMRDSSSPSGFKFATLNAQE